jgi:hypothetical protein
MVLATGRLTAIHRSSSPTRATAKFVSSIAATANRFDSEGVMAKPKNLCQALNRIQDMLDGQPYSAALWDILVALRGPDSRNRKVKNATTALIRSAAFPKRPCEERSIFGTDSLRLAKRRKKLFRKKKDFNHFREHVRDAFDALGLSLGGVNDI